jgi:hypothetical protein
MIVVVMVDLELGLDICNLITQQMFHKLIEFGVNTKETSFRDLYWIKFTQFQIIYLDFNQITVWKIGILLVLKCGCAGDKTPFPYNRVDTRVTLYLVLSVLS